MGKYDLFRSFFNFFDWVWSKLNQAIVTIGILKSQDMTRPLNSHNMISQVNVYVVDAVLRLCDVYVWSSIFNIGSYDVVKKFL